MRFLVLNALLLLSFSLFSQKGPYNFSKLDIYNGLSHNQVNAILKDQDGFLWFGTLSGLDRYDGYSFKVFSKKHNDSTSLTDNSITSLSELPDGRIWVVTGLGPCIYDSHTEKFDADYNGYLHTLGLPSGTISRIVKGNKGRYWFLYNDLGLYLYTSSDKKGRSVKEDVQTNSAEKIGSVREANDGKLWLIYLDGLLQQYDIDQRKVIFSTTVLQKLNKENTYNNLFIDNDGDVWLWYYTFGVLLFHPQDNSVKWFNENSSPSKLSSKLASQIVQGNDGLIWVSTDHGGVTLIDKKKNFLLHLFNIH